MKLLESLFFKILLAGIFFLSSLVVADEDRVATTSTSDMSGLAAGSLDQQSFMSCLIGLALTSASYHGEASLERAPRDYLSSNTSGGK